MADLVLGVNAVEVDFAGMGERLGDRRFRDRVEDDAADLVRRQVERLDEVPGDGFAFTVKVGGEVHALGLGRELPQLGHGLDPALDNLVSGLEVASYVDAELSLGQIADVPERRFDDVAAAEVLADRLRLGGRLDDYERATRLLAFTHDVNLTCFPITSYALVGDTHGPRATRPTIRPYRNSSIYSSPDA